MNFNHLIFHFTAASILGYSIYFDLNHVVFPPEYRSQHVDFAGRLKYLTFLNALLQFFYYSFSVLNDLVGSSSKDVKRHSLQKFRDFLFASWAFPLAMFVSISFWSLWAIDRELVFPKALDAFIPVWLNHVLHTVILPLALIEMVAVPKVYPQRPKAIKAISIFFLAYTIWVFFIAFYTGYWVYPVLQVLDWPFRILFIASCAAVGTVLYLVGETLHFARWGKPPVQAPSTKRGKQS